MIRRLGLALGFLVISSIGCAARDDLPPPFREDPGGGPVEDAGTPAECEEVGSPTVMILAPPAESSPSGAIVDEPFLSVECLPMRGDELIDEASVQIEVRGSDGRVRTPTVTAGQGNAFNATANLSDFPNGPLRVRCYVEDTSSAPLCGVDTVDTFLDLGPEVTILRPTDDPSIQGGSMSVRYRVTPKPLVAGSDPGSAVVNHTLTVAGKLITNIMSEGNNEFSAVVDFGNMVLFPTPLMREQLIVRATNVRGITREVAYDFIVDSTGPTIVVTEPLPNEVISGSTEVVARVTDSSGVDSTQVSFRVRNSAPIAMEPTLLANEFQGSFDASQYPLSVVEVTIDVRAVDIWDNATVVSVPVKLDIVPPLVDMDPVRVRELRMGPTAIECSHDFDPLGDDSVSDGQVTGTVPEFRVRVDDRSNVPVTNDPVVVTIANTDLNSVQVFVLDDHTQALVVDTDGDGLCDSINPAVEQGNPAGNQPAFVIDMVDIGPDGTSDFTPDDDYPAGCGVGTAVTPPEPLCPASSPLLRVMPSAGFEDFPGVFGKPPVGEDRCVGDAFDFQPSTDPGWACVAARALDNAGNSNVSAPMRVCFSQSFSDPACDNLPIGTIVNTAGMPSCTDGCTPERITVRFFGPI